MQQLIRDYSEKLARALAMDAMQQVPVLGNALREAWATADHLSLRQRRQRGQRRAHRERLHLRGGDQNGRGLRVEALSANTAVMTSLANDVGYEESTPNSFG